MSKNDTSLAAYLERMGVEIVYSLNRHQYATVDKYRRWRYLCRLCIDVQEVNWLDP